MQQLIQYIAIIIDFIFTNFTLTVILRLPSCWKNLDWVIAANSML